MTILLLQNLKLQNLNLSPNDFTDRFALLRCRVIFPSNELEFCSVSEQIMLSRCELITGVCSLCASSHLYLQLQYCRHSLLRPEEGGYCDGSVSSENVAIRYVLPVSRMTSCSHTMDPVWIQHGGCHGSYWMDEADKGRLMTTIGVSGWMFLLVPAHPGCPGQNPESRKTVVCVCVDPVAGTSCVFPTKFAQGERWRVYIVGWPPGANSAVCEEYLLVFIR